MDYAGLGIAGAVVAAANGVYYFRTILTGRTKPHRITWFGWSLVGILGTWSALSAGAGAGAYVALVESAIVVAIFLVSLSPRYGKPGGRRFDYLISVLATMTIIVWQVVDFSPGIAVTIAIAADLWFTWLTVRECWFQPETEAVSSWIISVLSSALGVAALESFDYAAAAFPVYILLGTAVITAVLLARRVVVHKKPHDEGRPIL